MATLDDLVGVLRRLHRKPYPQYKQIKGRYDAGAFTLAVDYVQGDPFAAPSRVRAMLDASQIGLPEWAYRTADRRRAAADYLNRAFARTLHAHSRGRGSGRSGELRVLDPGQEVLDRSSILLAADGSVEARFRAGLPADGRRILGDEAAALLTEDVPAAVREGLRFEALDAEDLERHVACVEDAVQLRAQLVGHGLVAFVADGAVLPRHSGIDDRPKTGPGVVPFASPDTLRVTLDTPNAGPLEGMGIPRGITLIAGGGYHGKSTLLRAVERGVYDHIPGDGRERVVTVPDAVKVRAEDGRQVSGTDIVNFITNLPGGGDTTSFHTENASGSTSQAAAIVEALEVGASCLLLDEDTSATNFMIRDARMQQLVADENEPITPYIDRARQLFEACDASTVLVVGGSGDYFDVADTVLVMQAYRPRLATEEARAIAAEYHTSRRPAAAPWRPIRPRYPSQGAIRPGRGRRDIYIKTPTDDRLVFGREEVDLSPIEQLVEPAQARAIAEALARLPPAALDGQTPFVSLVRRIGDDLARRGFQAVHPDPVGELAAFRVFELAAFWNRLRTLTVNPQ